MAKYTVTEARDANGKETGWVLLRLPDDFKDGDLYPPPSMADRYFDTYEEAVKALQDTVNGPPAED
jgi:hypothetical protein